MRRGAVPVLMLAGVLVAVLLAVLAAAAFLAPSETLEQREAPKYSRICDVQVYNGYLRDSSIQSVSCRTGNRCYAQLSIAPLALFSDNVRVRLEVGDAKSETPLFNLDEGKSYTARVSACSSSAVGRLTLLDEKGQQVGDAKGVQFG